MDGFTSWDYGLRSNELAHFGVKGMKWGQRRFRNEDGSLTALGKERYGPTGTASARRVKKDLNKLDKEQANARVRYKENSSIYDKKSAKYHKKMTEALANKDRKTARKLRKNQAKLDKTYGKKAEQYNRLLKKSEGMTQKILQYSKDRGYKVKTKDVMRSVNVGRNLTKSILGTVAGVAAGGATGMYVTTTITQHTPGKKYKVKN